MVEELADWLVDESSLVVNLKEEFVAFLEVQASTCILADGEIERVMPPHVERSNYSNVHFLSIVRQRQFTSSVVLTPEFLTS